MKISQTMKKRRKGRRLKRNELLVRIRKKQSILQHSLTSIGSSIHSLRLLSFAVTRSSVAKNTWTKKTS